MFDWAFLFDFRKRLNNICLLYFLLTFQLQSVFTHRIELCFFFDLRQQFGFGLNQLSLIQELSQFHPSCEFVTQTLQ
jgi:hypothetical protein